MKVFFITTAYFLSHICCSNLLQEGSTRVFFIAEAVAVRFFLSRECFFCRQSVFSLALIARRLHEGFFCLQCLHGTFLQSLGDQKNALAIKKTDCHDKKIYMLP